MNTDEEENLILQWRQQISDMDRLSPEQRHRNMQNIKAKDTSIERIMRKALWDKGFRYRKNYTGLPGKPDIAITKYKIAIFCDSEFFHGKDWDDLEQQIKRGKNADFWIRKISRNIVHDNEVDMALRGLGWIVLRFWGKDIKNNVDKCVETVQDAILQSRCDD